MTDPRAAYAFCDASLQPDGTVGAGCVVVCGDAMAYRSFRLDETTTTRAEIRAAFEATRFAIETFPGIEALLITSDCSDVSALPFGTLADGVPDEIDPSGILGLCRAVGVRHAIRWWPGHSKGAEATGFIGNVAHALAQYGAGGTVLNGATPYGQGWRSRMATAVGTDRLNQSVGGGGLSPSELAAFTGLSADAEEFLPVHLRPRGRATTRSLSAASEIRDAAESAGIVVHAPDDLGEGFLEGQRQAASSALFLSAGASEDFIGHAVATLHEGTVTLRSWRKPVVPGEHFRTLAALHAGRALADEISRDGRPGVIDVVTADPGLARLIATDHAPFPEMGEAGRSVRDAARDRGAILRPCVGRVPVPPVGGRGRGLDLLTMVTVLRDIALVGYTTEGTFPVSEVRPYIERLAEQRHAVGMALTRRAQEALTAEAFRYLPEDSGAAQAFGRVAERIHRCFAGRMVERPPVLPAPGRDGSIYVLNGTRRSAARQEWAIDAETWDIWAEWRTFHAYLQAKYPILELSDVLANMGGWPGPGTWPADRVAATMAWLDGDDADCPFGIAEATRPAMRERLLALREAAGAWPFPKVENRVDDDAPEEDITAPGF